VIVPVARRPTNPSGPHAAGRATIPILALLVLLADPSVAQTLGRISGAVRDSVGDTLAGVTLTLTGPTLPGKVVAESDAAGDFDILNLPPGSYLLTASRDGFNALETRDIRVGIDRTVTLELVMNPEFAGELTVVDAAPVVDVRHATTGISFDIRETFDRLPLARDVYAIASLVPGASSDPRGIGFYGSTSAENRYVIEGLDTTGVRAGTVGKQLNFDFLQEVEIKTGGLPAEYGRLTGGLINAITRSGGNDLRGDAFAFTEGGRLAARDRTLAGRPLDQRSRALEVRPGAQADLGFDLGGFVLRDRLWYFLAYNQVDQDRETRVLVASPTPGSPAAGSEIPASTRNRLYAGKLTWRISGGQTVAFSVFGDPSRGEGDVFKISGPESTWRGTRRWGSDDLVARYDGILGPSWVIEGSLGRHREREVTSGEGATTPQRVDRTVLPVAVDGGFGLFENQRYTRDAARFDATRLLGGLELKAGVDAERTRADVGLWAGGGGQRIDRFVDPRTGKTVYRHIFYLNDRAPGFDRADPSTWKLAAPLASQPSSTSNSAYASLTWRATAGLTLVAGLRYERQRIQDRDGVTVIDLAHNWAPRLGFSWDPWRRGRAKLYGSWGRYFENIPMGVNQRAFGGEIQCACYNLSPAAEDIAPDPAAGARSTLFGGSTEPVDPALGGQYLDEALLGYEFELRPNLALGTQVIHRALGRVIEDFLILESGGYFIANPGEGLGRRATFMDGSSVALDTPKRDFWGLEIHARRRYANGWQLYANYLWSKLEGNYEGVFQASNGQLDPNLSTAFDYADFQINADGPLMLDRRHALSLAASYTVASGPLRDLNFGLTTYWRSGTPQTARGFSFAYANWEYSLTPRGALGRGPADYEADLHLAYPWRFGEREVEVLVDVFNALNRQAPTELDQRYNLPSQGPCAGIPKGACNGDGGLLHAAATLGPVDQLDDPRATAPNPSFLSAGTSFTDRRSVRLGLRFRF
jgi:hypothetical protein